MNDQVQTELKKIFNGRFSTSVSTRTNYARGEDTYDPVLSKAVVFPETNEEVSKILKLCNDHKVPVVPFGTGTSLEGNVVGNEKGITISLEKMNKVLSVNVEDFDCRVQACVTKEQLNDYLREDGVFFPIDPGANAAIGGMASTSASGTMAVKYGTMKTVITGLTVNKFIYRFRRNTWYNYRNTIEIISNPRKYYECSLSFSFFRGCSSSSTTSHSIWCPDSPN
jgi:D-lactate dehydrogenase (cytochrome)